MKPRTTFVLLAIAVVFLMAAPVSESQAADPLESDIRVIMYPEGEGRSESFHTDIHAGSEKKITFRLENTSEEVRLVSTKITDNGEIDYEVLGGSNPKRIGKGDYEKIDVIFSTSVYATGGRGSVNVVLMIESIGSEYAAVKTIPVSFTISSSLSSEESYNKIMRVFENNLPAPFDNSVAAALITMAVWFLIAFIVAHALVPVVLYILMRNNKTGRTEVKKSLNRLFMFIVILMGIGESLMVAGAPEYAIDLTLRIAVILYILTGALIVLRIYKMAVEYVFRKRIVDSKGIDETLVPLFNMIGKIVIVMVMTAAVFSALGADLMGIIAGAGIAGLAVSLGAQKMLGQFFSGLMLLTTRPFKEGDIIKIGNSEELKVSKVGVMTTWFTNPWNEEIITMPNDVVSSSNIINMTGDSMFYRFNLYVEVAIDTDLELARNLMVDAANDHPKIIKDGSVSMPFARSLKVTESGVQMRLSAYVYNYHDHFGVEGEMRETVLRLFRENGIEVAFPRTNVKILDGARTA
jgi:potassium efflux system protein